MSIASEIQRIQNAKTVLISGLVSASVEVSPTASINDIATSFCEDVVPHVDNKIDTEMDIEMEEEYYVGEDLVVDVIVSSISASGYVNLLIGTWYNESASLSNGRARFIIPEISCPSGNYLVLGIYGGDSNCRSCISSRSFEVVKNSSEINISVSDITVGQTEVVYITPNPGATGYCFVSVYGKDYVAYIDGGFATLSLTDLPVGTYMVQAMYLGDDRYKSSIASGSFTVS